MKALYFEEFGDSNVLQYGQITDPVVSSNDILVQINYSGLNFADIYRRNGEYHIEKNDPYINGYEGLGRVIEIGDKVTKHEVGDKVFFVDVPFANASLVSVPEESAIKVPNELDDILVASIGLQGLTADFLSHDLANIKEGDNVFIHGISGGVGQILSQILTANGANVYGVTSTEEKKQVALEQGARKVFLRAQFKDEECFGYFDTVFDGIGTTVEQSIQLLKNKGKLVFFGMAAGNPPAIDLVPLLTTSKSILTGDLWDFLSDFSERKKRSERLFNYFMNEHIQISEPTVFPLSEGKSAHDYLESGKSIGKVLLKV